MFHVDFKLNSQNWIGAEEIKASLSAITHKKDKKKKTKDKRKGVLRRHPHPNGFFLSRVLFKTLAVAKLGQKWSPVRPSSDLLQPWGSTASTNCRIFPACWLNLPARQELTLSNMATRLLTAAHDFCFSTQPFVQYTTYSDDTVAFDAESRHWNFSRSEEMGGVMSAKPQA